MTPATTIAETNANVAALGGVITQIQPNLKEYTPNTGMLSGISPNGREFNFTVNVNTGIGDPNAIAEAVTQVIQDAVDRGTLRGGAY
jgi:predicted ester cyclase